ncbi:hypothetical protein KDL01_03700 [Actinospica durhamensis]|uniref:GH26 domain-containing protein n=1 Tax=Actinospica durhamensis TaxID=1508375 RepID=A0A941EK76_9ACTN|nr:glycosyl hydrolase [Actinospica durhamensis]MBR7832345.1 hypothetical protein [Actinospica durhamensis]
MKASLVRPKYLGLTAFLAVILAAACVAVLVSAAGGSGGPTLATAPLTAPTGGSTLPEGSSSAGGQPAVPAAGHLYIGADIEPDRVSQFDSEVGIDQPAVLGGYTALDGQVSPILAHAQPYSGTAPMVSWELDFTKDFRDGSMDSYLRQQAAAVIAYGKPVFLRPDWEMDGNWYPDWSPSGVSAGQYITDWRYVVRLFRTLGVTNAAFVWCPNVGEPLGKPASDWYPGDAYVDWIGSDAYPRQSESQDAFTETDGLDQLARFAGQHGKPMMLAEWGVTSPDPDNAWLFDGVFQWAAQYPQTVKALVYFDYVGTKGDHMLVDHPNGAAEFKYLIQSDGKALTTVAAEPLAHSD